MELLFELLAEAMVRLGVDGFGGRRGENGSRFHDPAKGLPSSALQLTFRAARQPKPAFVMVGMARNDWRYPVLMRYGERLRLQVPRGVYRVVAWYFTLPPELQMPVLVAIAEQRIHVLSDKERATIVGWAPVAAQLDEFRSAAGARGLPFLLPDEAGKPNPADVIRPRVRVTDGPQADGFEIVRHTVIRPGSPAAAQRKRAGRTGWDDRFEIVRAVS